MAVRIKVVFDKPPSQPSIPKDVGLRVPNEGEFLFIRQDDQRFEFGATSTKYGKPRQLAIPKYEQKKPMPATCPLWACKRLKYSDFIPMARDWQFFIYDLLAWAVDHQLPEGSMYQIGTLLWAYADFISDHRAFTDQHAPETEGRMYADYVTGRNLDNPIPYMIKCLATNGNILRKVEMLSSATAFEVSNYHAIEALDLSKPAPTVEWVIQNKPWLIHWATEQSVTQLPNKRWVVARFPQLKVACRTFGLPEVGTPYPLVSWGGVNFVRKTHVKPIANGAAYSPYVPEKL